jgi:hypothetical protein
MDSLCREPITMKYASDIAYLAAVLMRQGREFKLHDVLEHTPWFIYAEDKGRRATQRTAMETDNDREHRAEGHCHHHDRRERSRFGYSYGVSRHVQTLRTPRLGVSAG